MELFERIQALADFIGSRARLARMMDISPQKMAAYMSTTSQKNFYERLPLLMHELPGISRDWLYFGDGDMMVRTDEETPQESREASDISSVHAETIGGQAATISRQAEVMEKQADTIRRQSETIGRLSEANAMLASEIVELKRRTK